MTPIRNLLSDAVRYGLATGAVGLVSLAANPAFAQAQTTPAPNTDTTKAKNLDKVTVLGSRIKRAADSEPTQPVTTLTRADIAQTGLSTTFDVLNHITASDGSGLSTVTTQTNGSDGTESISLRDLGPQRTLILVDGKRWPTDANGIVDTTTIPVAIIERIDVLKEGASSIYGSDAIAGVINIITRKKFEGAEASWYYGQTSKGDGARNTEEVTIGAASERSSGVISLSRAEQKAIFAGDRERSAFPVFGCKALLSNFPASDPNSLASNCGSGSPAFGRFRSSAFAGSKTLNTGAAGTKLADFHPFTPLDRYNFAPINYLQQPSTRNNLFASGRFNITDNITAYARANYTQRQSSQQLAEVPLTLSTAGIFGPPSTFGVSQFNVFNPFGADVTRVQFRNVAVGPRHNNFDVNTLGSTAGVEGSFSFLDRSFDWDLYAQYNSSRTSQVGLNYINLFNLRKALGPSRRNPLTGALECLDAPGGAVIANCVPYNIFSGPDLGVHAGRISAAEAAAMIRYVSYTLVSETATKDINYGGTLSGDIVALQGGELTFATGFETRRKSAFNQPDALVAGGGSSSNFQEPTNGKTKVDELFLEINAPLLKDMPFAKELELDFATRKSRYSGSGTIGTNTFKSNPGNPINNSVSLRWKPIDDILIRGSYGRSFRAPSVNDLFAGNAENFPNTVDPCSSRQGGFASQDAGTQARCIAAGVPAGGAPQDNAQLRAFASGNPILKPEHGHNLSYGVVWSPSWDVLKGLNITVDYYRITLHDALTAFGAGSTLSGCFNVNDINTGKDHPNPVLRDLLCGNIQRDPITKEVILVNTTQFNAANFRNQGIDYGVTYRREFGNWGTFGLKWDTTYLHTANFGGGNAVGIYNGAPNWKYRSVATLDWTRGDWDASWTARYTSKLDENAGCNSGDTNTAFPVSILCNHPNDRSKVIPNAPTPDANGVVHPTSGLGFNRIGSVVYHDVQVGWRAPWKAHLAIGARNVFGKEPPLTASSFASSFDASYDLPGGPFYYFQYRQDF